VKDDSPLWVHACFGQSVGAAGAEDDPEGAGKDDDIQPDGPVTDVEFVQADAFFVGGVIATGDLPHAGDARFDLGVEFVAIVVAAYFVFNDGPGTDQAHFAFQHVPELGEFVEAVFAQISANASYSGVIFKLVESIPFLA